MLLPNYNHDYVVKETGFIERKNGLLGIFLLYKETNLGILLLTFFLKNWEIDEKCIPFVANPSNRA